MSVSLILTQRVAQGLIYLFYYDDSEFGYRFLLIFFPGWTEWLYLFPYILWQSRRGLKAHAQGALIIGVILFLITSICAGYGVLGFG